MHGPISRACVIEGLGTALPAGVVTNDDLARELDTSDEWIRTRTGIGQRHIAGQGVATSDLAVAAGTAALDSAGAVGVDAVVLATTTPDRPCPATAPTVAARLGLGPVPAFDVSAVCSGMLYALVSAAGLISGGVADRVLVIGADTYSSILDPADRSTRAIFGDGAGAVVVRSGQPGELGALGPFDLGSDGNGADLITVPSGGSSDPLRPDSFGDPYFRMEGQTVYREAVARMTASTRTVLDKSGWDDDAPDLLVAHQANVRILAAVASRLGLPQERCAVHLDRVGNTAAGSIVLALGDAVRRDVLHAGDRVVLTAFGGGLTWGAGALCWPDVAVGPCVLV